MADKCQIINIDVLAARKVCNVRLGYLLNAECVHLFTTRPQHPLNHAVSYTCTEKQPYSPLSGPRRGKKERNPLELNPKLFRWLCRGCLNWNVIFFSSFSSNPPLQCTTYPTDLFTIKSPKFRSWTDFMKFRNVDPRILRVWNCEMFGQGLGLFFTQAQQAPQYFCI